MKSIDFSDIEPSLGGFDGNLIGECEAFRVEKMEIEGCGEACRAGEFAIFTVVTGRVRCGKFEYKAGDFFLVPASLTDRILQTTGGSANLLRTIVP